MRRRQLLETAPRRWRWVALAAAVLASCLLLSSSLAAVVDTTSTTGKDASRASARSSAKSTSAATLRSNRRRSAAEDGSLRLLLVGHELSLTGAPLVLLELAIKLRAQGHDTSFLFLDGGPLEAVVAEEGFHYGFMVDADPSIKQSMILDNPGDFDVVLVNTVVLHPWLRNQVEAWGLGFMRKVLWWVHELPVGNLVPIFTGGITIQRALLARAGAVVFDSEASRQFWENWVLGEAYWLGLDYSPLIGRQESWENRKPPLPSAAPHAHRTAGPARLDGAPVGWQCHC